MDVVAGLAAIGMGLGILWFITSPRTARSLDFFGSGFVPYRGPGWPHGVQEEEPVRWAWSSRDRGRSGTGSDELPELVDVDRDGAPPVGAVQARIDRGMARRRR